MKMSLVSALMSSYSEILTNYGFSSLHQPVLFRETLNELMNSQSLFNNVYSNKANPQPLDTLTFMDGTFGRGGHSLGLIIQLCQKFPGRKVIGLLIDHDHEAQNWAKGSFLSELQSRLHDKQIELYFYKGNASEISGLDLNRIELIFQSPDLGQVPQNYSEVFKQFDIMLLDLGVSSPQLDQAERGFSFYHNGPLDMRMNHNLSLTAADVINSFSEEDLVELFKKYGEIFKPYRVVRALVHDRKDKPFEFTQELSRLIERVDGWSRKGHHPATNYFMALRLYVNQELEHVRSALPSLIAHLKIGGRLAVISFHSLEDRIVKWTFKESIDGRPVHKKVIEAQDDELLVNSRARSAKLRIFERIQVQDEPQNKSPTS